MSDLRGSKYDMNVTCVELMRRSYTLQEHAYQYLYPHNLEDIQRRINSQLELITNG